jgi:hypothetical protein
MWLGDRLGCVIDRTSMLTLLELIPAKCSSQCHDVLYSAVIHILHTIWMARNVVRYSPDGVSLHAAKVYAFITLSGLLRMKKVCRLMLVLEAEIHGFLLAMEYATQHQWSRLWIESESTSAVSAFKNPFVIPFGLRNRWHNCTHGGFQVIASHIFREGNGCADKLANHGHSILNVVWWDTLPIFVRVDFFRDRFGRSSFRYP